MYVIVRILRKMKSRSDYVDWDRVLDYALYLVFIWFAVEFVLWLVAIIFNIVSWWEIYFGIMLIIYFFIVLAGIIHRS